jgi:S1-C subfamily serine protease
MDAPVTLVAGVVPATVTIQARVPEDHPSAQILGQERMGTGTLIDREGHILTVNYIVMGAQQLTGVFMNGREAPAEIVFSRDFESGLALIKIAAGRHPIIPLGDSRRLTPGQFAFIVASVGEESRRVTSGVVTAVEPFDAYWEYMLDRAILFTAPNPGVGGGPLVSRAGELVGIVSLNLNEIARMSLAIPIEVYTEHAEEMRRHGRIVSRQPRAWIGFYAQPTEEGIVVAGVVPRGPAERCGVEEGDLILAVDDERIADRRELYRTLWKRRAGERVRLTVRRRDAVKTVPVETQDRAEFYY